MNKGSPLDNGFNVTAKLDAIQNRKIKISVHKVVASLTLQSNRICDSLTLTNQWALFCLTGSKMPKNDSLLYLHQW